MTWNYRVIQWDGDEPWQAIHEVYYDEAGHIVGWSEMPVPVVSYADEDLYDVLQRMARAVRQPALVSSALEGARMIPTPEGKGEFKLDPETYDWVEVKNGGR